MNLEILKGINLHNDDHYKDFTKNCQLIKDITIETKNDDFNKYFLRIRLNNKIKNEESFLYLFIDCYNQLNFDKKRDLMENPLKFIDDDDDVKNGYFGEIIADNSMTRTMIDYLMKTDDELSKLISNTTALEYRARIIASIHLLWD